MHIRIYMFLPNQQYGTYVRACVLRFTVSRPKMYTGENNVYIRTDGYNAFANVLCTVTRIKSTRIRGRVCRNAFDYIITL